MKLHAWIKVVMACTVDKITSVTNGAQYFQNLFSPTLFLPSLSSSPNISFRSFFSPITVNRLLLFLFFLGWYQSIFGASSQARQGRYSR